MKRRQFFSFLAKSASTTSLAVSGATLAQAETKYTQLEVLHTQVNGLYYHDIEQIAQQLKLGQKVWLKPEPDNQYDNHAIEVYYQTYKLGYIPQLSNRSLFAMLKQAPKISAYISDINPQALPYNGLEIKVFRQEKSWI